MIGQTIAHYRVTAKLGAGGMGEVYRATDSKLGRDVALKVLPAAVAQDDQRMQRFQREAQVLASLNHPHIAAIYGLEHQDKIQALAMELVEGPTLAERIEQGAIPVDEALPIAQQIAEALEYAHERGIVHRDLKPANVKLTADGQVKVLDFGLAKALQQEDSVSSVSADFSPTLSLAATKAGIILGTAAYMAPEQARGKQVDRRADIWSFGVVLYEMLSGQRAYSGEDISVTLANVIKEDPEWDKLPPQLPLQLQRLLLRCLTKDPRNRLRDIGEARIAIEEAIRSPQQETATAVAAPVAAASATTARIPWAVAAVLGLALVVTAWALWPRSAPPAKPVRLNVQLSPDASIALNRAATTVLSPDGSTVAFLARVGGTEAPRIFLRRLDQLNATPLSATEGARHFFFSPDGQWIGFFANDKLKKISVTGGAAVTLCDAQSDRGGWWGDNDVIVFGFDRSGLSSVSAAGGKPEPLTKLDEAAGEATHRWPQVLPGAKAVMFTAYTSSNNYDEANIVVQVLATGERKVVQRGGYYGRYVPTGHLLYINQGTLFAAPFDLDRLETAGQAVPAIEEVSSASGTGGSRYSLSDTGSLIYLTGVDTGAGLPIHWMDRDARFTPLRAQAGIYFDIQFSPDGRKLAIEQGDGTQVDIWVYEWARDTMTRLTFDSAIDADPAWSPDSRHIAFTSDRGGGPRNLYWKNSDGTGDDQRLTESKNPQFQPVWHPGGKLLVHCETLPETGIDLMVLPLEGDERSGWKAGKPSVFLSTPFIEATPAFSPDGRWLAYTSNESGRFEVYVRPFPGPGGKWQVSTDGGGWATWSPNGKELFYRNEDQRIMAVNYTSAGDSFRADKPVLWSQGQFTPRGTSRNFDLHPDGKRFAVLRREETTGEEKRDHAILILNFFDELRRLAPPGGSSAK